MVLWLDVSSTCLQNSNVASGSKAITSLSSGNPACKIKGGNVLAEGDRTRNKLVGKALVTYLR